MIRRLLCLSVVSLCIPGAQLGHVDVRGELTAAAPEAFQCFKVELASTQGKGAFHAHVDPHGRFEIRAVPEGQYMLAVLTQHGDRLQQEPVQVMNNGVPLTVRLQQSQAASSHKGLVSLRRLQHRPAKAALKAMAAAQRAYEKKQLDEMHEHLEVAAEADPEFFEPLMLLGRDHLRRREFEPALARLRQALEIDSTSADGHALTAYGLWSIHRPADAAAEAKHALQLDPSQPVARHIIAAFDQLTSKSSAPTASAAASSLVP